MNTCLIDTGVDWQRQDVLCTPLRFWQFRFWRHRVVIRRLVNRRVVVNGRANAAGLHRAFYPVPCGLDGHGIQVPVELFTLSFLRDPDTKLAAIPEQIRHHARVTSPYLQQPGKLFHLDLGYSSAYLWQPHVQAKDSRVVAFHHSMISDHPQPVSKAIVVGCYCAALAGSDHLACVHAVAAHDSKGACLFPLVRRAKGLTGVLDDQKRMLAS